MRLARLLLVAALAAPPARSTALDDTLPHWPAGATDRCKLMSWQSDAVHYTPGTRAAFSASQPGSFTVDGVLRGAEDPPSGCAPLPAVAPATVWVLRADGGCAASIAVQHARASGARGLVTVDPSRADAAGDVPALQGAGIEPFPAVSLLPGMGDVLRRLGPGWEIYCTPRPAEAAWAADAQWGDVTPEWFAETAGPALARLEALVWRGAAAGEEEEQEEEQEPKAARALWLASFPNTGTTWLRRLFEEATGFATESVYDVEGAPTPFGTFLDRKTAPGLPLPGFAAPRVIKCHCPSMAALRQGGGGVWDAVVHVYRHPFDALASNWRWAARQMGSVAEDDVGTFLAFARHHMPVMVRWHCAVAGVRADRLVLRYEDALRSPEAVGRAARFGGYRGPLRGPFTPPAYEPPADWRVPIHLARFNSTTLVRELVGILHAALDGATDDECGRHRTFESRLDMYSGLL